VNVFEKVVQLSEMPSLPFWAGDSRIQTSSMASRMAGPISHFHLLPTAHLATTATRKLVKLLSCC